MSDRPQNHDYPIAIRLMLAVNAVEDRLGLIATTKAGDQRGALLTRRLVRNLLDRDTDM